jgi:UDP-N-acetylglucosamine--N-acetylmuramyl-(pentapeptide) pyrophosphoryl-undecaprenol N-acetylglucosamine transferase
MKVAIACGGTGGHLFPGLAVAETLAARRHRVHLLVSDKAVDRTSLTTTLCSAGLRDMPVTSLSAVGLGGSRELIRFCRRFTLATGQCRKVFERFEPDVVLGMGGFTSAPAIVAARWFGGGRRRSVIHESNAVPGKANSWTGNVADRIAVGLAECGRYFRRKPVTVTGTPLRRSLRAGKVAGAHEKLGLDAGKLTVVVMGGSQGAQAINRAVIASLPEWSKWKSEVQFVHLSGTKEEETVRAAYEQSEVAGQVMGFCHEMELVYSVADVMVTRAGASSINEITAFGVPSVLVPFPQAAGNHQWHNARVLEKAGAARLVEQRDLPVRLSEELNDLVRDETLRARMGAAARALAVTDAAERIADLLEKTCSEDNN